MRRRCRHALLTSLLAASLTIPFAASSRAAELADSKPRIIVMSAFEPEVEALLKQTEDQRKVTINGVEFTLGRLSGQDVVVFMSGISMVNATMNTQLALDRFNVRAIVFSGIAGGVNPALHIGDVVVAKRWGQYLESVFARQIGNKFVLPPFFNKVFPNFGMIFPQNVTVRTAQHPEGQ